MCLVEFGDIDLGGALLGVARGENLGAVLGALIGVLPVQLCRVVRYRKIDLQQAAVGDLLRIEGNLDRFGVPRAARADLLIARGGRRAARISRNRARHAQGMLKHRLNAPETAAGKNRSFSCAPRDIRHVDARRADRRGRLGRRRTRETDEYGGAKHG